MKPTGEDIATAVREWAKDEIKKSPADFYDLGKFCFTVASGSAGLLAIVEKLGPSFSVSIPFILALLLYFCPF